MYVCEEPDKWTCIEQRSKRSAECGDIVEQRNRGGDVLVQPI